MRNIQEYKETSNSQVYRRARKKYLADKQLINCSFCPYHKGENATRYKRGRK